MKIIRVLLGSFFVYWVPFFGNQLYGALVTIDTVLVGDAGNAADFNGAGAVPYEFSIGKYEVTISQYVTFLNSVASTSSDSHVLNLWNSNMTDVTFVAGISRNGSGTIGDPYSYASIGSGNRPIAYVSWLGAARLSNWLHNGATDGVSTETGAYMLNGATSGFFSREAGATWWIPSDDEWYKSAYYKGGSTSAGYWLYPTASNTPPSATTPPGTGNSANYDGVMLSNPGGVLTSVGAYSSSGPYGTYDQGGNLGEFNETGGRRGMYWQLGSATGMASTASDAGSAASYGYTYGWTSDYVDSGLGFRLASIYTTSSPTAAAPEPGQMAASIVLILFVVGAYLLRRKKSPVNA